MKVTTESQGSAVSLPRPDPRPVDSDIDAYAVELTGFEVIPAHPVTTADIEEFLRTHKRIRYTLGPDGSLTPVED
jgi:hypothetical protein